MREIKRTHPLEDYIDKRRHAQFDIPFVTMIEGGDHEILTAGHFDR
jgi:hypothetical protein